MVGYLVGEKTGKAQQIYLDAFWLFEHGISMPLPLRKVGRETKKEVDDIVKELLSNSGRYLGPVLAESDGKSYHLYLGTDGCHPKCLRLGNRRRLIWVNVDSTQVPGPVSL